jgi:hypothetical protein
VWDVEQVGSSLGALAHPVARCFLDQAEQRRVVILPAAAMLEGR